VVNRIRPQIALAILCGTIVACVALLIGYWMGAVEIVTAVVGSIFGFLAGVSFKLLESE
jgi:membrane associated rhomboid family serine protease